MVRLSVGTKDEKKFQEPNYSGTVLSYRDTAMTLALIHRDTGQPHRRIRSIQISILQSPVTTGNYETFTYPPFVTVERSSVQLMRAASLPV